MLVVGAGQAGLGAAYHLTRTSGLQVLVLDRHPIGQSWLDRWDSLRLFTPRRFSSLPGLAFPAGPTRCPSRLEMAAYLQRYAHRFDLPVRTGVDVRLLRRPDHDGGFVADTSGGAVHAHQVVIATGPFSQPHTPDQAAGLAPDVHQLHSSHYRRAADIPPGDVLVVGGGNSAAQLAVELAATHRVTVAAPRPPWYLPTAPLGIDLYWWTALSGVLSARSDSPVSRYVRRHGDAIVGTRLRELDRAGQVRVLPHRVIAADGRQVRLADGTRLEVTSVLWCTGFRPDTSWLDLPGATGQDGTPHHRRGSSPVPGLHWMGLPWQSRLDSSIIHGIDADARALARRLRHQGPHRLACAACPPTAAAARSSRPPSR